MCQKLTYVWLVQYAYLSKIFYLFLPNHILKDYGTNYANYSEWVVL